MHALCIDVLILSCLCDQMHFFHVLLLLPSGLGDVPIETLTDFRRAESKSLRRKWMHKGNVKCIGKPEIWHLESFHCSAKMAAVCCCFLTCRQTGCVQYLYISHLHDVFYSVIFFSRVGLEQTISYSLYLVTLRRILELFISCVLAWCIWMPVS